jgi:acyl-CoA synthetase (AMP-forming)/AMP-acid ligase II
VADASLRHPDSIALAQDGQEWTWLELNRRVDALCAGLAGLGISRGDIVFVMSHNNLQAFETIFALARLGAVDTRLNFRYTPGEVAHLALMCRPCAFIVHRDYVAAAEAAAAAVPELRHLIVADGSRKDGYESLIAANSGKVVPMAEVRHDDPWRIGFSSGSTGAPKAIVNSFGQIEYTVANRLADVIVGLKQEDAFLSIGPLSHGSATAVIVYASRGARTVMLSTPSFREEECFRLIEEHRITGLFLVPTMLMRLVRHPSLGRYDLSSLKHVVYAGAPISRADQKTAIRTFGKALIQYYGSGETLGHGTVLGPELHTLDDDDPAIPTGTIGFPRTGTDIAIMSENMEPLPNGTAGLLCIRRGPGAFLEYFGSPDATAEVFRDGWYLTGDIGKIDERGFVYIVGRSKDIYKSGGMQVFPMETEQHLLAHEAVAEAYVVPFPDPEWGEIGVAVVCLNDGRTASEGELREHLRSMMAAYKLPKRIFIWESIARAESGKVLKSALREEIYARNLMHRE